jgi:ribonuclease HI
MSSLVIYTDGACSGNPGPGGWAWAVAPTGEPHAAGGEPRTTNQRMEIHAVLDALQTHAHLADDHGAPLPIEIVSDSTYVVNCFRDRWWVKWQRNGWTNSQRKPVANVDLWKPLIDLVNAGDVSFRWVKGHSGDPMNDLVDKLAVAAIPRGG